MYFCFSHCIVLPRVFYVEFGFLAFCLVLVLYLCFVLFVLVSDCGLLLWVCIHLFIFVAMIPVVQDCV